MSNKVIIIAAVVFFVAGVAVLFAVESINHDYDRNKTWTAAYYNEPAGDHLDFTIENHEGREMEYEFEILVNGKEVLEEAAQVGKAEKKSIFPRVSLPEEFDARIVIEADDREYSLSKKNIN